MFVCLFFLFDKKIRKESIWEIQWEKVLSLLLSPSLLAPEWVTGVKRDAKLPPVISSQHAPVVTSVRLSPGCLVSTHTHTQKNPPQFSLRHASQSSSGADQGHCRRGSPRPPARRGAASRWALCCYSLWHAVRNSGHCCSSAQWEKEPKNTVVKYIATLISSLLKECSSEAEESSVF